MRCKDPVPIGDRVVFGVRFLFVVLGFEGSGWCRFRGSGFAVSSVVILQRSPKPSEL